MNPALPLLLVVALSPLLRRRRGWALAWAAAGLAGTLLLWPALAIPDGVPSPAASAGAVAPWAGRIDPARGNPTLSDVSFQIEPWLIHLRRELRAGRMPFWNPYQFAGAPFWSNGQSAPLFPLHLLFAALPLQLGLLLLPWLRIAIGGVGAWALARELEVPERAALVAAVVYPLAGVSSSFVLFPMANALCLAPWMLRETERLAQRRSSAWWRLGALVGLALLGGHPETVAHTLLAAAIYLAVRGRAGGLATWGRLAAAAAAGALVSAVQLLPLLANVLASSRWQEWSPGGEVPLSVLLDGVLRLVLPDLFGHPSAGTWYGPYNYNATAVFAGAVTLPLAWLGLRDRVPDRRWVALAAMTALALLCAYQVPPFGALLRATPLVDRMLHHRLLFVVDLGLALAAAAGAAALADGRRRGLGGASAAVTAAVALAWLRHGDDWRRAGLVAHQGLWSLWIVVGLALLLAGVLVAARRGPRPSAALAPAAGVAIALELVAAHARTNPGLALAELLPRTPAIESLAGREGRIAAVGACLRPNAAMIHELHDVRGDDTLKLARYERAYRSFGGGSPFFFAPVERWSAPWLDRLGVRWVMTDPGAPPPEPGWPPIYDGTDARVYERPGALPLLRWEQGSAEGLEVAARAPGRWRVRYSTAAARRLVVAETWDPGWRARSGEGSALAVETVDEVLLAVPVAAGRGEVELRYRPRGLVAGLAASLLGLGWLVGGAVLPRARSGAQGRT